MCVGGGVGRGYTEANANLLEKQAGLSGDDKIEPLGELIHVLVCSLECLKF